MNNYDLRKISKMIRDCNGLIVAAGAGISFDSGLPDFRSDHSYRRGYSVLRKLGLNLPQIVSPWAFKKIPTMAWGFFGHCLKLCRDSKPHDGFRILQTIGERTEHGYFVYTSNVDGQFQKAGFDQSQITEIHGTIHKLQCLRPCRSATWSSDTFNPVVDIETCQLTSPLPLCPNCNGLARPNICLFNDTAWLSGRSEDQMSRFSQWLTIVSSPLIIEIGAGTAHPHVRYIGNNAKTPLIRVNPHEFDVCDLNHIGIKSTALEFLNHINHELIF